MNVERFHCPICGRFVPKAFWVAVPEGATFVVGDHPFIGPCRIYSCNHCTSKTVKLADSQVIVSMNWVEWNQDDLAPEAPVAGTEPVGPWPGNG